jgi:ubiquinone/menaquinone biosynthesis C-methylase UbiE
VLHKKILEICCGEGDLAAWIGTLGNAEVIGLDSTQLSLDRARENYRVLGNVSFVFGDVANMQQIPSESVDLIIGQASMHHLTNNIPGVSAECCRVLKPGGKLLFVFEPLGHNPIVAAIRGIRNSRAQYVDESNLYYWIVEEFARNFHKHEIFPFSLLAYLCKGLPKKSRLSRQIYFLANRIDQLIFKHCPASKKYAANANICFWK